MEHPGKNGVFINCAILDCPSVRIPYDLLVLLEPSKEKMNLHHRTPSIHVGIEIFQVWVIIDWLVI
jgi:hypothetical protein